MATGLALSGVGVGGLIIAPLTEFLVRHIGVPWSQRISAIYTIVFGAIACYFVRVPFQDKSRTLRNFDWKAFHDRRFAIQALMVFFATAAYLVPVSYLPQFWTSHGVGAETASVMIAISNVSNAVGRLAMGVAADYIGVLNSLVLGVGCSTIGALVIWPFATSVGSGLVMGIIYGFGSGGYWTLVPLAAAKLFGIDKLASNTGIFYTLSALSAWIGNPVGGAILANSRHGSQYLGMIMYVGALWAVSFFFASCNRLSYSRQVLVKV
ncbi:hypothetical protein EC988_000456 [Linderina pennispora]|nr:hypothetical protein EC988_000456 [Linderina pennispora]